MVTEIMTNNKKKTL